MLRVKVLYAVVLGGLLVALVPGVGLASEAAPLAEPSLGCGAPPLPSGCGMPPTACPSPTPLCAPPAAAPQLSCSTAMPAPAPAPAVGTPQPGYSPAGGLLVLASQMDPNPLWPAA